VRTLREATRPYRVLLSELSRLSLRNQGLILLSLVYFIGVGPTWAVSVVLRRPLLPHATWADRRPTYWIPRPERKDPDDWRRTF